MPREGSRFISHPTVFFDGTLRASTGTSMTVFDDPQGICDLELRQAVLRGRTVIARSMASQRLVQTPQRNRERRFHIMPHILGFSPLTFSLDRRFILEIDLDVRFKLYLDGPATIGFSTFEDDLPFLVMTPQWSITDS